MDQKSPYELIMEAQYRALTHTPDRIRFIMSPTTAGALADYFGAPEPQLPADYQIAGIPIAIDEGLRFGVIDVYARDRWIDSIDATGLISSPRHLVSLKPQ